MSPSATGVVIRSRDAFILYPDCIVYASLLCFVTLLSLSVRETKRLFDTEFDRCFFSPPLSFVAVVADVVLCCDLVVCFCGVFVLGVRRRKWKVQKLQCCSCGGVCFSGF